MKNLDMLLILHGVMCIKFSLLPGLHIVESILSKELVHAEI